MLPTSRGALAAALGAALGARPRELSHARARRIVSSAERSGDGGMSRGLWCGGQLAARHGRRAGMLVNPGELLMAETW